MKTCARNHNKVSFLPMSRALMSERIDLIKRFNITSFNGALTNILIMGQMYHVYLLFIGQVLEVPPK